MSKKIIVLGSVVIIALIVLIFQVFVEPPPPLESVPPSVQIVESKLVGRQDGIKQWELLAKSVLQADDLITLRDLGEITIFQDDGADLIINASWATWQRKNDVLTLYGPLVVEGIDQFKLVSDELVWAGKQATLTSPGPATITWLGLIIEAGHMILETETDLVHLSSGVKIREGQYVFNLQRATYNLEADLLDFYGQVALELEGSAGHAGEEN